MTKREEVAMNSPERKEVSRQLAEELEYVILRDGSWLRTKSATFAPDHLRDALISREMRVRELKAVLRFFEDEAISSHPAEFVNSWTAKAFSEKVRLALNSKGEKR